MRAARTNLPILVLEGGNVCLLEELSWNSDARRKGEAADATPDLQSSISAGCSKDARIRPQQACLSPSGREASARLQDQGGQLEAQHLCLTYHKAGTTPPGQSVDRETNTGGSTAAGRSHAIGMPPLRPKRYCPRFA